MFSLVVGLLARPYFNHIAVDSHCALVFALSEKGHICISVRVIASDDGLYARIHMRDVYLVARPLLCIPP